MTSDASFERAGRYVLGPVLGKGGQGTVRLGIVVGGEAIRVPVAVKQLGAVASSDETLERSIVGEAEKLSRVHHANVVSVVDVLRDPPGLVMGYVHGLSCDRIVDLAHASKRRVPIAIAAKLASDVLAGLQALHEATGDRGELLEILHRDVTPDNVLVGADGVGRLVDLGIAKAALAVRTTTSGLVRGKPRYLAPELLAGAEATRRSDVFAAGRVFAELLSGRDADGATDRDIPPEIRAVLRRACDPEPAKRFATARDMLDAIELATSLASAHAVATWLADIGASDLAEQRQNLGMMSRVRLDQASESRVSARSRFGIASVGIALVMALVVGWAVGASRAARVATLPMAPERGLVSPVTLLEPVASAASAIASVSATPEPTAVSLDSRALVTTKRSPTGARGGMAALPHDAPAAPASASSCDPPYVIDEAGHTHFKRACLK